MATTLADWATFGSIMALLCFAMFLLRGCFIVAAEALQESRNKAKIAELEAKIATKKLRKQVDATVKTLKGRQKSQQAKKEE